MSQQGSNNQETQSYEVIILRRGGLDPIIALQTENFEKAKQLYLETVEKWQTSLTEKTPFQLEDPIITAFDPGLIYEVLLRPLMKSSVGSHNPYRKQMEENGFSNTFSKLTGSGGGSYPDLLDKGYQQGY